MSPRRLSLTSGYRPSTAYAVYFDYKRRSEPDFRRGLRRNERRQVRAEKEEAKARSQQQRQKVKQAVAAAVDEGFPKDPSEKEMYFMEQVSKGEVLGADREFRHVALAECFLLV